MASKSGSGFACMECGHKFKTVKAAEKASFGPNGCPKCGGSDIDLGSPAPEPKAFGALPAKPAGCKCAICTNDCAWGLKK